MFEANPPENTGEQVARIIEATPPIQRTTLKQEAIKIKGEMQKTKALMENGRTRLGNFCVSIGTDSLEGDASKVVMLIEPVTGITEYDKGSMNYVLVTDEGFLRLEYFPSDVDNKSFAKQQLVRFQQRIDEAVKSNGVITADSNSGYKDGKGGRIPHVQIRHVEGNNEIALGIDFGHIWATTDRTPLYDRSIMIEQALQASINAVREQNQTLLDQTVKVLAPVQTVREQLDAVTKKTSAQKDAVDVSKVRTGLRRFLPR